jgi:hypothetical protein
MVVSTPQMLTLMLAGQQTGLLGDGLRLSICYCSLILFKENIHVGCAR